MKRCRICHQSKPLTDFYAMAGMRDGYRNECKACNLARQAAARRVDPMPNRRRARQWQLDNPERHRQKEAEYRRSGRKQIADRKSYLKRKYGLTPDDYANLLAQQGGVCALCERPPTPGISLHVDHDHETKKIRGLLCFRCNNALGDIGDDVTWLRAAADYLEPPERAPELERRLAELRRLRLQRWPA